MVTQFRVNFIWFCVTLRPHNFLASKTGVLKRKQHWISLWNLPFARDSKASEDQAFSSDFSSNTWQIFFFFSSLKLGVCFRMHCCFHTEVKKQVLFWVLSLLDDSNLRGWWYSSGWLWVWHLNTVTVHPSYTISTLNKVISKASFWGGWYFNIKYSH